MSAVFTWQYHRGLVAVRTSADGHLILRGKVQRSATQPQVQEEALQLDGTQHGGLTDAQWQERMQLLFRALQHGFRLQDRDLAGLEDKVCVQQR